MKISDLKRVQQLTNELATAKNKHEAVQALLGDNKWGGRQYAHITLGGDEYGNGAHSKLSLKIEDVPELARHVRNLESDAWGVVVGIRAELRLMGVDL